MDGLSWKILWMNWGYPHFTDMAQLTVINGIISSINIGLFIITNPFIAVSCAITVVS